MIRKCLIKDSNFGTICKQVPEKCQDIQEEVCEPESKEVCSEAQTVEICNEIIEKVPDTMCTTVDVPKCEIITDEVCSPVYETKCTPVTTQSCR